MNVFFISKELQKGSAARSGVMYEDAVQRDSKGFLPGGRSSVCVCVQFIVLRHRGVNL
jgi:hypothetical protein